MSCPPLRRFRSEPLPLLCALTKAFSIAVVVKLHHALCQLEVLGYIKIHRKGCKDKGGGRMCSCNLGEKELCLLGVKPSFGSVSSRKNAGKVQKMDVVRSTRRSHKLSTLENCGQEPTTAAGGNAVLPTSWPYHNSVSTTLSHRQSPNTITLRTQKNPTIYYTYHVFSCSCHSPKEQCQPCFEL